MKLALVKVVAQFECRGLDRADGADKVLEDLTRRVGLNLVILAAVRHVVGIGGEEDEIVCLAHVDAVDDLAAERFARGGVLELRLAKSLQEAVLIAVGDLLRGEHHVPERDFLRRPRYISCSSCRMRPIEVSTHAMISLLEFT